jgi:hypothetical protein
MGHKKALQKMGANRTMKQKILVIGPALTASGYGEHARLVLRSLREYEDNFDIFFKNINWGQTGFTISFDEERKWLEELSLKTQNHEAKKGTYDVSVQVTIPNEWKKIAPINIGVTAGIETTKIAPQWIEKSALMNKIIVPSEHARYAFDHTSYDAINNATGQQVKIKNLVPVDVVHYPVKEIEVENLDLELSTEFNFLSVAQWGPRKNLENTIKWFVEEFKDEEVGLVLKANIRKNSLRDRRATTNKLNNLLSKYEDRKCKVYLLHGNLSEGEMYGLYRHEKIKAIVSTTHGEGYGLPLFEAVYNELPVVAPNWSGHLDFLYAPKKDKKGKVKNKAHFTKVDYDLKPIQKEAVWDGVLVPDGMWCYAKEVSYKRAIRDVYKNYGPKLSDAKKIKTHVLEEFSKEKIYKLMAEKVSGESLETFDKDTIPKISIITSVYDGDEYIDQFMEDITRQTIFEEKCELILVNANSPGNEKEKIEKWLEKYPENIKYFELDEDPGIYGTWNFGIEASTGEFITNANLDDRKAPNSLERHAKELVLNPKVDLVYADSYITHKPNETYESNSSEGKKYNFEKFSKDAMLRGNQPHNNPMWRRSIHDKHGLFNSDYKSAGDWEFFLRSAFGGSEFKKINGVYGLYYFNPKGISTNIENNSWKREEEKNIFMKYKQMSQEQKREEIIL